LLATPASLIAITAGQAVNAMALQVHACAAKAGINQLVRVLALEWGPDVRVNGISPGPIAAPRAWPGFRPMRQARTSTQPDRRQAWGEIDEVADAAVWLCSDAASYVTGTIIDVDGGSQVGDASRMDLARGLA
jgi:NAD(P)-dependent dehydrogenase (short-subunit alcohol dehydrogenase family)